MSKTNETLQTNKTPGKWNKHQIRRKTLRSHPGKLEAFPAQHMSLGRKEGRVTTQCETLENTYKKP